MPQLTPFAPALLTIAMIGVVALVWGGTVLIRRGGPLRTKGILMLVCAAVLLANILIRTV